MLLSFAQFERELASERVRDKVAASRRKGKWTGGSVPLGYDAKNKRLIVNPAEAKTIQLIFNRYLVQKSFQKLIDELNKKAIVTKRRKVSSGPEGGVPFTYGSLAYLLKNRIYLGEMGYGGSWFPGEHEPILDRDTFDNVQHLLSTNSAGRAGRRRRTGALLTGLIYDDRGNRMSPSFSVKRGVRYPFYVSSALLRGRQAQAGAVARVSAQAIENAVLIALRHNLHLDDDNADTPRQLVENHLARVVVETKRVSISMKGSNVPASCEIPWSVPNAKSAALIDSGSSNQTERNASSLGVQAIVRAHAWLKLLTDGTHHSIESLARAVDLHPKVIRSRIRLAFLPPIITKTILRGVHAQYRDMNQLVGSVALSWREHLDRSNSE